MRDLFEDIRKGNPLDPREAARRGAKPQLRKRFYQLAAIGEPAGDGHPLLLDGRPVRTPARRPLAAPSRSIADALAGEWNAQGETVDPSIMPLTRLANTILDGIADNPGPVADDIVKYAGSDLLCYRADAPDGLVADQTRHWDPVLDWARDELGARFMLSQGIVHVAQPEPAIAAVRSAVPHDPWSLGALHVVTTLTGSALLALALARARLTADEVWAAGNVDEDWNMARWGEDETALERRAQRYADLMAASTILAGR